MVDGFDTKGLAGETLRTDMNQDNLPLQITDK